MRNFPLQGKGKPPSPPLSSDCVCLDSIVIKWDGGFERVLDAWHDIGSNLMNATHNTSKELGRNPQSVGKSKNHWSNLHTLVGFKKLRSD